jgi:hypothetical protein
MQFWQPAYMLYDHMQTATRIGSAKMGPRQDIGPDRWGGGGGRIPRKYCNSKVLHLNKFIVVVEIGF